MKFYYKIFFIAIFLINSKILLAKLCVGIPNSFKYNSTNDLLNQKQLDTIFIPDECWNVFSIKENINIYKSEELKKIINNDSLFLDRFEVISRGKEDVNVLRVKKVSDTAVSGWAKITDFITLPHAYRDENKISYKAMIVNKVDSLSKDIKNSIIARSSPDTSAKQYGQDINVLQLPYVYSFYPSINNPNYILIGKNSFFLPSLEDENDPYSIKKVILGWIPFERVILWNTREAFEPNTERVYPIYCFKEKKDLIDYYNAEYPNEITPICGHIPSDDLLSAHIDIVKNIESEPCQYSINREAMPDDVFRYPIFKDNTPTEKKYKGNLFYIGIPDAKSPPVILKNIIMPTGRDIVFLIDATKSMEDFIPLVIHIVLEMMEEFRQKTEDLYQSYEQYRIDRDPFHNELRFGIFVYRDPSCGTKEIEKIINLTQNSKKILLALDSIKTPICGDKFGSTYYLESLYLGIKKTIGFVDWTPNSMRKIIVIGDAGDIQNADLNEDSGTSKKIAELLCEKKISLSAIQIINHPDLNNSFNEDNAKKAKTLFTNAQKNFSKDILSIINNIARNEKNKLENFREFYKEEYDEVKNEIKDLISETTYDKKREEICWKISKGRWSIDCLEVGKDYKNNFTKKVKTLTRELSKELYQTRDILEKIMAKNKIVYFQQSDEKSYRPDIARGVITDLIKRIGKNKAGSNKESWSEEKIIQEGTKELIYYLEKNPNFFTTAYVLFKHPKKMSEESKQFIKKIFINRKDLQSLHEIISLIIDRYQGIAHPNTLLDLWEELLKKITKEKLNTKQKYSESINQLIYIHMGIKLKSEHPFLTHTRKEILQGKIYKTNINDFLMTLRNCEKKISNLLENKKKSHKIFYEEYYWVNASDLL